MVLKTGRPCRVFNSIEQSPYHDEGTFWMCTLVILSTCSYEYVYQHQEFNDVVVSVVDEQGMMWFITLYHINLADVDVLCDLRI